MRMEKPKFTFYTRPNGTNEVVDFIESLPIKDKAKLLATIYSVQNFGIRISERQQWVKKLDSNIYEIRSRLSSNIQRVLYFHLENNEYIVTHGFTKKSQKTPIREIQHANMLRREYFNNIERN